MELKLHSCYLSFTTEQKNKCKNRGKRRKKKQKAQSFFITQASCANCANTYIFFLFLTFQLNVNNGSKICASFRQVSNKETAQGKLFSLARRKLKILLPLFSSMLIIFLECVRVCTRRLLLLCAQNGVKRTTLCSCVHAE